MALAKEISSQLNIGCVLWLLVMGLMKIYNEKEQRRQKEIQNSCGRGVPEWRSRDTIAWIFEGKAWIVLETPGQWRYQNLGMPSNRSSHSVWNLHTRNNYVAVSKTGREEPFKSFAMGYRNTGFAIFPDVFNLALVWYFFTMPAILPFGIVMYILCHSVLEVYDLLLIWFYMRLKVRNCVEFQKKLWTF